MYGHTHTQEFALGDVEDKVGLLSRGLCAAAFCRRQSRLKRDRDAIVAFQLLRGKPSQL